MLAHELEQAFSCPHCAAAITMLLDPTVSEQAYIEDCEVCCRPIHIHYRVGGEQVTAFEARPVAQ